MQTINTEEIISFHLALFVGIEECLKQKQWVNENSFEVLGSQLEPDSNGPNISRIKHEQNV
jgi:hypothetical protein